jgi:cytochrome c-type biogenesis protein CcmH/NrfG
MPGGQPLRYLATQFAVILWYMRLFVLPTQLCFDYGWPLVDSFRRFDVIGPGLLLIALLWAAVRAFSVRPLVTFCVLWFFVILAPTSSIIPIRDVAAEHRMYLAIVPLSWVLVSVAGHTLSWSAHRWPAARGALVRAPALILFFGWLVMLGWLTVERNRVFQDRLALAADTARKAPHNWSALHNLGNAYADHGRIADAVRAYQAAIDADPSKGSPRINLAQILAQRGQRREAEEQLKRATQAQVRSVSAKAFLDLGRLYEEEGRWQAALAAYRHALQRMPEWAEIGTRMRIVERRVRESEGR